MIIAKITKIPLFHQSVSNKVMIIVIRGDQKYKMFHYVGFECDIRVMITMISILIYSIEIEIIYIKCFN